jgi:hypothetical protein
MTPRSVITQDMADRGAILKEIVASYPDCLAYHLAGSNHSSFEEREGDRGPLAYTCDAHRGL